ncbi:MAG: carboxypeptidase regulatory-like domain-containing protein [Candidatus Acidiferrales bacterium]
MARKGKYLITALSLLLSLAGYVHGQGGATGAISGAIRDEKGTPVANAVVTVTRTGMDSVVRELKTDDSGNFTAALLASGYYDVSVKCAGFAESHVAQVIVRVTETTRLTVPMQTLAATKEEKTDVIRVIIPAVAVETSNPATGRSMEEEIIHRLPLATQNFQQLMTLSPGTFAGLSQSANLGRGNVNVNVNGSRDDDNNYLIEGISASDYNAGSLVNTPLPSPEALQEFKVQTSLFDATQGRNGGGNINAVLKSGDSQFHGSAFEYFRNDALNANDFFANLNGMPRTADKQNLFGASLGGPVGKNSHLGNVFLNYQGTRQTSGLAPGTSINTVIPVLPSDRSAASLAQAFFGSPYVPLDPLAVQILNLKSNQFGGAGGGWLVPSLPAIDSSNPSLGAKLLLDTPGTYTENQFTANWDRGFRQGRDKLSERFFFSNFQSHLPFGASGLQAFDGGDLNPLDLNFPMDFPVRDRFLSLVETHLFSPQVVNEFRFGFLHINNQAVNEPLITASQLGIQRPNLTADNLLYKFIFPGVQAGSPGYAFGPSSSGDLAADQNNLTFLNTTSLSHGKHFFRLGGEFERANLGKSWPEAFSGQLTLPSFDAYLVGEVANAYAVSGISAFSFSVNDYALFGQDDYKPTPTLTLNLGFRWELFGAAREADNQIANVDPSLLSQGKSPYIYPTSVSSLGIPGLLGTTNRTTLNNSYSSNFGPRLGIAYDVGGHHTTSIRAGYGIYYVRDDVRATERLSHNPPFTSFGVAYGAGSGTPPGLATLFQNILPPAGVVNSTFALQAPQLLTFIDPTTGLPTSNTALYPVFSLPISTQLAFEVPRNFVSPSVQQWNLTVQRSLWRNWLVEVGYVGSKGTHLRETRDTMQALLASPQNPITVTGAGGQQFVITQNTSLNVNARSRALGLSPTSFFLFGNDANSEYNSLQATVSHRFSHGLHFQAAYTYSKSIDETSTGNTLLTTAINDQTSLADSRGLSDFDRTHRLVVNYVYNLPFFAHAQGWKSVVLGRWEVNGITIVQSGAPFTVYDSLGGTVYGISSGSLNVTASLAPGATLQSAQTTGSIGSRLDHYLNPAAFVPATIVGIDGSTGFGDLGRNTFRGPHQQNWDASIGKSWQVRERQSFRFAADFFNVWNHPSFANPAFPSGVDVRFPNSFGAITSTTGTPRIVQLSIRYSF